MEKQQTSSEDPGVAEHDVQGYASRGGSGYNYLYFRLGLILPRPQPQQDTRPAWRRNPLLDRKSG
jgi:hypothetical protein